MAPIRFIARHLAIGFIAATVFVVALMQADPDGLGTLLHPARSGVLPVALLWLFTGLTFAAAQFATALGLAPEEDRGGGRGRLSVSPPAALRPVRVPAMARAARRSRSQPR